MKTRNDEEQSEMVMQARRGAEAGGKGNEAAQVSMSRLGGC